LLNLKEPTVSHHLTKLKELSLVQMRPEGNTHLYQLNSETLQQLSKVMFTPNQRQGWVSGRRPKLTLNQQQEIVEMVNNERRSGSEAARLF